MGRAGGPMIATRLPNRSIPTAEHDAVAELGNSVRTPFPGAPS